MIEFMFKLDETSDEALYMQLYRHIRDEIVLGHIAANVKLPSIRRLSAHLGVSRSPVALAYEQLLAEGYVRSKPRSGLFAAKLDTAGFSAEQRLGLKSRAVTASGTDSASAPAALPSPKRAYHASQREEVLYDFGYGSVDVASFPLAKWRRLMNRCLQPANSRLLLYGDLQGEPELRAEIAVYLRQMRGVHCLPEQIVVGAGTYHSLDLLFQLLQEDVTCMAAEEAVNDGVKALFEQFRFDCQPLQLESDGVRVEQLYSCAAQAVYVTPSHQFPYGMTMSAGKRIKLLQWATEQNAYIVENDYDGEFRYSGRPIPSLQSFDEEGRVIYVGTFSRSLTPSFRLSYLVLPLPLLERFRERKHSYDQLASPIFQMTLQMFMQTGDFERHMRKMRSVYHKKRDVLLSALRQAFPEHVDIIGADSGLHVLLRVQSRMSETELVEAASREGVAVYPISAYMLAAQMAEKGQHEASTVLLGFGGLSESDIRSGVGRLAQAWQAIRIT
ncbi:MocR-like pyridoxine biosynthesis transcription factor PdxR [Paenibacillus eucommiae]|uniref:GntR family transcriptional regulator/MocR family aminotransferase n=1 Tax=Paenibacillus eucommiae TaxID=1355755 RepID=A0ABS4J960_9BACL|nr:PLP-dependent aminotransferase family protein [Paenibacillus eucommiae]MBP1996379.1 GntR family transcriptional regulator/MocR family aminotransferase [Paenibacillus eucommiae]